MATDDQISSSPGLSLDDKKLIMFGGKGGVGKTVCAAGAALHLANNGAKTLILSTDPAPSLSDLFEMDLGTKIHPVQGVKGLFGLELQHDEVLRMWREKFGQEVYEVISSFVAVDESVLDYIQGAPGLDEEFMLAYIADLIQGREFDVVVWDTAPAGNTLRLLKLEEQFFGHLTHAARMYVKFSTYLEKLREITGRRGKGSPLKLIEQWKGLAEKVMSILRDRDATGFVVITIAEALGVSQTRKIISELDEHGIGIEALVINQVLPEGVCTTEFLRKRFDVQSKYVRAMMREYGKGLDVVLIPLLPYEVKGLESLVKFENMLFKPS